MSPQNLAIMNYLARHGSITAREAMFELNIGNLKARVHELRKSGWNLPMVSEKNETNKGYHGVYTLSALDLERMGTD